ncbi:MAG: small multi-drug export protein [Candidatus Diapherotrites archaeon]|nr:small multi-drug export protein [Candidatus Diapherotrites archaeon]
MFDKIVWLILLTFVPVFELRWSIPIGLFEGEIAVPLVGTLQGFALPIWIVFITCVIANIILGVLVYFFLDKIIDVFLKVNFIKKYYDKIVIRAQNRSKNLIEKYGLLGIALFVAIPLPGSGSWTGALIANLLDLGYKKFFIANLIGVLIAATIVTIFFVGAFSFFAI